MLRLGLAVTGLPGDVLDVAGRITPGEVETARDLGNEPEPSEDADEEDAADAEPAAPATQSVVGGSELRLTAARKKEIRRAAAARAEAIAERKRLAKLREQNAGAGFSVRIASFNVLGSQHTAPGGQRRNFPSASWRTPEAAALVRKHGTTIVGLQELKGDQLAGLRSRTGFAAFPSSGDHDNAIMWNPSVYEFVSGSSFPITFMNSVRPQTVLRLRHKETGREFYVINMHASAGRDPKNTGTRVAGWDAGVRKVNELKGQQVPIFMTGDMNDRGAFFCRVLPPTGMVAAVGGSTAGGCRPPGRMPVDWVVGHGVSFSNYVIDESPVNRKVSDHFYISATGTVPAL